MKEELGMSETTTIVEGRTWIRILRLVLALLLMSIGLFLVSQAGKIGYSDISGPGPGFFPFWVGLLLSIAAFFWLIAEFRANKDSQVQQDLDPKGIYRVARLLLAVMLLTFCFVPLGYNISVLFFMLFLTTTMGKGKVSTNIIVSFASSFGIYLVFEKLLDVPLPDSFIPFLSQIGL
jgi:putative tricarboxylic transport membrane protein